MNSTTEMINTKSNQVNNFGFEGMADNDLADIADMAMQAGDFDVAESVMGEYDRRQAALQEQQTKQANDVTEAKSWIDSAVDMAKGIGDHLAEQKAKLQGNNPTTFGSSQYDAQALSAQQPEIAEGKPVSEEYRTYDQSKYAQADDIIANIGSNRDYWGMSRDEIYDSLRAQDAANVAITTATLPVAPTTLGGATVAGGVIGAGTGIANDLTKDNADITIGSVAEDAAIGAGIGLGGGLIGKAIGSTAQGVANQLDNAKGTLQAADDIAAYTGKSAPELQRSTITDSGLARTTQSNKATTAERDAFTKALSEVEQANPLDDIGLTLSNSLSTQAAKDLGLTKGLQPDSMVNRLSKIMKDGGSKRVNQFLDSSDINRTDVVNAVSAKAIQSLKDKSLDTTLGVIKPEKFLNQYQQVKPLLPLMDETTQDMFKGFERIARAMKDPATKLSESQEGVFRSMLDGALDALPIAGTLVRAGGSAIKGIGSGLTKPYHSALIKIAKSSNKKDILNALDEVAEVAGQSTQRTVPSYTDTANTTTANDVAALLGRSEPNLQTSKQTSVNPFEAAYQRVNQGNEVLPNQPIDNDIATILGTNKPLVSEPVKAQTNSKNTLGSTIEDLGYESPSVTTTSAVVDSMLNTAGRSKVNEASNTLVQSLTSLETKGINPLMYNFNKVATPKGLTQAQARDLKALTNDLTPNQYGDALNTIDRMIDKTASMEGKFNKQRSLALNRYKNSLIKSMQAQAKSMDIKLGNNDASKAMQTVINSSNDVAITQSALRKAGLLNQNNNLPLSDTAYMQRVRQPETLATLNQSISTMSNPTARNEFKRAIVSDGLQGLIKQSLLPSGRLDVVAFNEVADKSNKLFNFAGGTSKEIQGLRKVVNMKHNDDDLLSVLGSLTEAIRNSDKGITTELARLNKQGGSIQPLLNMLRK
ncbi:hypothetical protein [Photobacterium leiognathi]|uniref:hypothetical protein n=1 Tax=Photobacterium leiognathi TaxID=553611 RepID=UPI0029810477|nr:hypothetical protein [Photobacterium leiognathi]